MRSGKWVLTAAAWGATACGPSPSQVADEAFRAFVNGDRFELERTLSESYTDPEGSRSELLETVRQLWGGYDLRTAVLQEAQTLYPGASRARAQVSGQLTLKLEGRAFRVQRTGRFRLGLVRDGFFRIDTGFLTELRTVLQLVERVREGLEANDRATLAGALHPRFRYGPLDERGFLDEVEAEFGETVVRLEIQTLHIEAREELIHVDVEFRGHRDDKPWVFQVARLTLAPDAGRWTIRKGALEARKGDPTPSGHPAKISPEGRPLPKRGASGTAP